ncbi:MAG: efflux RND transporter periplasmic adaptor subunit [Anaerovoracaceae bacterium]
MDGKRRKIIWGVGIVLGILAAIGVIFLINGDKSSENMKSVTVHTVEESGDAGEEALSGNIVPVETAKMSFKISGIIADVLVSEGEDVAEGQALASLDTTDYVLAVDAAEAQWLSARMQMNSEIPAKTEQAKAQLDLTQITYDRIARLYEQEAVSKAQLDEISAKLTVDRNTYKQAMDSMEIAQTQLGQAKAAYDSAVSNLSGTTIYSPFDGFVLKKLFSSGETVSAGYPVVVIGNLDKVWAEVGVPDSMINSFKLGQEVEVYIYGADEQRTGIVDEISSMADSTTRLFTVKVILDNENHELKAGMIAKVMISPGADSGEKIMVPVSSVINFADGEAVFVYDEEKKAVYRKNVSTGEIINDKIEILAGLKEGDKIVVEGQQRVKNGEKVLVND